MTGWFRLNRGRLHAASLGNLMGAMNITNGELAGLLSRVAEGNGSPLEPDTRLDDSRARLRELVRPDFSGPPAKVIGVEIVTVIAAAIDTVPNPPQGGGGGVLAWVDRLLPVIAALVGAGLGFWASAHQSRKDRAHAGAVAQRQAVADFLAEYRDLTVDEGAVIPVAAETVRSFGFKTVGRRDAVFRPLYRIRCDSIWKSFVGSYAVLLLRLEDGIVAKEVTDVFREIEQDRLLRAEKEVAESNLHRVLADHHQEVAVRLSKIAKDRLGMDPVRLRKLRDAPAPDADPNE